MSIASAQLIKDFNLKGMRAPVFFRSAEDIEKYAGRHPYSHFMRRAWQQMNLNGILCVEGRPTVYFKEVKRIDSLRQRQRYRKFWNQGLATLLVVKSPKDVQVFSSLAEPAKEDSILEGEHRLVETLESTTEMLNLVRRVQSGQIYRDHPESFNPDKAVDKFLLKNLRNARDLLHGHKKLKYKIVHALLGRVIFTCYLIEREIIDKKIFNKAGAKGINNLHELFNKYDGDEAKDILYKLFAVLQRHFNGSMFDATVEEEHPKIHPGHIEILKRFLNGEDLQQGQLTFDFWAYDFHVIPVETISSIYEEFLAAEDEDQQRKSGAYYTPKHLAEMVVDIATDKWNLLGKRILDPACGSGVFLVILFNRIAEQWRRRNPGVYNITRTEALLEIISQKLCGVDVNETACRIASFSLYLAFLDQLSPRDIHELEKKRGKILDNFLALKEDNYKNTETPVIFEGNFFEDVPIGNDFDLIIGNPPWVSRGKVSDTKALEWCLSDNNPYLEDGPRSKADRKQYFLPAKQIAHAFMWKAPSHLKPNARVCLVLPTKVLFNNDTNEFQSGWFSNNKVDKVIQLSDWRKILFENAICPAVIVKFERQKPAKDYSIEYEVPKVNCLDPRRGIIDILPEDRKTIKLSEIQESAKKKEVSTAWKKRFWGTRRDILLLDRLLEMPRLGEIVGTSKKPKRFISSQGFKPYLPEYYEIVNGKRQPIIIKSNGTEKEKYGKPKPVWWSKKHLYVDAKNKYINLILTKLRCDEFGQYKFKKDFTELYCDPDEVVFNPPMVLINQGFSRKAFCDFPVVFRHALQSISCATENTKEDTNLLMFLAAVLNTNLANYCFFHISANIGIERSKVHLGELGLLPFPLPKDTDNPKKSCAIIDKITKEMIKLRASIEKNYMTQEKETNTAKQNIERLVYDYYGISEQERMLIEDTVKIFKKSMMPTSASVSVKTIGEPTTGEREGYVELLCGILNSWAKRSEFRVNGRIEYSSVLGESIVTLWKSSKFERVQQVQTSDDLQVALKNIQQALPDQIGRFRYHRNLKVFDKDNLYILKPLTRRHWTKTAAINDADEIAAAILSSGGDS